MIAGAFAIGLALGVGLGFVLVLIAGYNPSHRAPRAHLPPATARQLRRARRESRLQLGASRWIEPARTERSATRRERERRAAKKQQAVAA